MARGKGKNLANTVSASRASIRQHVRYSLGKEWDNLSGSDLFPAVALAIRDQKDPPN